jgi:hypothetical protein
MNRYEELVRKMHLCRDACEAAASLEMKRMWYNKAYALLEEAMSLPIVEVLDKGQSNNVGGQNE